MTMSLLEFPMKPIVVPPSAKRTSPPSASRVISPATSIVRSPDALLISPVT